MLTLKDTAEYIMTAKLPQTLKQILNNIQHIFTFTQERSNRLKRFVKIVRAYKQGMLIQDIEKEYGCSKSTILRYARMVGLEKRPKGFTEETRKATILLYKNGTPIAQIQAQLGVSQAYISKLAVAEGINRRRLKKRKINGN